VLLLRRLTFRRRSVRAVVLGLVLAAVLPQLALAGPATSDCDSYMPATASACLFDVAQYGMFESVATTVWQVDRVLLGGAYWLDALRHQFTQAIFLAAYQALADAVGPLLGPMAILALMVGALALIALPITGSRGPINFRNILIWGVIGPLLLALAGPYLVEFERIRTDLGTLLFTSAAGQGVTIGGGASKDMAAPGKLYPSAACGAMLGRYTALETPAVDEQVAALVWASAQDIHCPGQEAPSSVLPDRMFYDRPDGPGYFHPGGIRELPADARQRYLQSAQEGISRLLLAVLPAFVAMLIALLNFVFACCTMLLWFSLPLGLLFSFFQTNANWFVNLVQRGAAILKTSWTISILLGVFSSILLQAGMDGDALRFCILTIISGIFVVKFGLAAFGLFTESLNTMAATTGLGGGPSLGRLAGGAATLAAGVATGGAATALTIAAAAQQTGSGRYALAAGAGRFRPLMQLGEVAASMGLVGDEVSSGLYAGHRSAQSARSGRVALHADAKRKGEDGLSIRERASNRKLDRQYRRAGHGSLAQRTVKHAQPASPGGRDSTGTVESIAGGNVRPASVAVAGHAIATPAATQANGPALVAGKRAFVRHVLPRDRSREVMYLKRGNLTFRERLAEDLLPAGAATERLDQRAVWAKLRAGHHAQRNDDGSVTYWLPPDRPAREAKAPVGGFHTRDEGRRPARAPQQQMELKIEPPHEPNETPS
jgi:hypothetical protein